MSKLCLGCMQQKENSPFCEHCGYDETRENLPHQLPVGTLLQNQYLVGRVLGQGGFGITYMGWDQHLSVPVAIKEYFPGGVVHRHTKLGTDVICETSDTTKTFQNHKDRFLKEARTLAQLADIPEIVQIKTFFPENFTAYIVMEFVQGITLKDHLKKLGRPMTEQEALAIMEPVLKALQKVHDQKLIHRDISPDNIMLTHDGSVKLIDFGTVRYMDESGKSKSTEAVLKPGFAPMEQYNTRGNLGTWTDVYAICTTFHYLLTGKVPADVHSRLDDGEELTMLRNIPDLSKNLIDALEKGMRIRFAERIQTIQELRKLLYEKAIPTSKKPQPKPVQNTAVQKSGSKKGLLALCAVGAVTIAAAGALLLRPQAQIPQDTAFSQPEQEVTTEASLESAVSQEEFLYQEAEALEADGEFAKAAIAFGKLAGYSDARERSMALWATLPRSTFDIASGAAIGLKVDGTVVMAFTATDNSERSQSQERCLEEISGWTDMVSVSIKYGIVTGLKCDGTVTITSYYGVPYYRDEQAAQVTSWENIVYLDGFTAVTSDGRVVGFNTSTEWGPEDIADWSDIQMISSSGAHIVGLKSDGTAVHAGRCGYCSGLNIWGWSDLVSIQEGGHYAVALKSDGTILMSGCGDGREVDAKQWKDIIAICTGGIHTVGLKSDGTVVAAGYGVDGRCQVSEWTDIVAIDADSCTVGLKSDGTLVFAGREEDIPAGMTEWTDIQLPSGSEQAHEPQSDLEVDYANAEQLLAEGEIAKAAIAFGKLESYRDARERSFALWSQVAQRDTISAGGHAVLAIQENGITIPYEVPLQDPAAWVNVVAVSVGDYYNAVGLKADGTVVVADDNRYGQAAAASWTDIVAISAGSTHTVGLKMDGTVVAAGDNLDFDGNYQGQCDVSQWEDIVAVAAGNRFTVGLKSDGTVVMAGANHFGLNQYSMSQIAQWTDIVAIRAGQAHIVGLRSDGTVLSVGQNTFGECKVQSWTDIVAVCAGEYHTLGLKSDGTVLAAGSNEEGRCNVSSWKDIVAIAAGYSTSLGLRADGSVAAAGEIAYIFADWSQIHLPEPSPNQ